MKVGPPIRILVSACLLGEKVRYDGGHKRDDFVVGSLARFAELIRVCPEVDCGMQVPREPMRLVGDQAAPRLVEVASGIGHTERMLEFARRRCEELASLGVSGYVCKAGSPSSGKERIKVFEESGVGWREGSGLFTAVFMERFPMVPVDDEERLRDPLALDDFINRAMRHFKT